MLVSMCYCDTCQQYQLSLKMGALLQNRQETQQSLRFTTQQTNLQKTPLEQNAFKKSLSKIAKPNHSWIFFKFSWPPSPKKPSTGGFLDSRPPQNSSGMRTRRRPPRDPSQKPVGFLVQKAPKPKVFGGSILFKVLCCFLLVVILILFGVSFLCHVLVVDAFLFVVYVAMFVF